MFFFCSKHSSPLLRAAYFLCQKFQSDPSLKTQSSRMQHWAGFFAGPIWKRLEEHAFPSLSSHFKLCLGRCLTTGGAVVRGGKKWAAHIVRSCTGPGHLVPGLCWDLQIRLAQPNGREMGSPGSFLSSFFFRSPPVSLSMLPFYFSP